MKRFRSLTTSATKNCVFPLPKILHGVARCSFESCPEIERIPTRRDKAALWKSCRFWENLPRDWCVVPQWIGRGMALKFTGTARMRTPSDRLIRVLTNQKLCTATELAYCEPYVRQLCQDLPDFDSVWLDALVQQRLLTAWQADQLQNDEADCVVVGRFQRQRALGRSTFLATDEKYRLQFVVRQIDLVASLSPENANSQSIRDQQVDDLLASIDRFRSTMPSSLTVPNELIMSVRTEEQTESTDTVAASRYLVSPYIPGWSMEELLTRGGRLPWDVVAEVGRELLAALAWLESARLLHGDLVLRNVRLDLRGRVHLVDPFSRRLCQPQFALNDQLTLRDCDGVAPEQVGTGRTADGRGELYALGCLLWQLLTSRPVVLSADPVTRMMKQKDHDIADVRGPVPDCPEWMSRLIQSMTRRSPELRPSTAAEVLKSWKSASGKSLSHCRALARRMPDHASRRQKRPTVRTGRQGPAWLWPASAVSALLILVFMAARSGVLPQTLRLSLTTPLADKRVETNPATAEVVAKNTGPVPLPDIDTDGVIHLDSDVTYLAERREFPGTLRIECGDSRPATILVPSGKQWVLQARTLELRGITVAQQSGVAADPKNALPVTTNLLAVQSGALTIDGCVIQSPAIDNFSGLAWHRRPATEGSVVIRNSVFAGGGYAVSFNHPPRRCELENVLMANRGSGILCEFRKGDMDSWDLFCTNVTQRFGFSVVDAIVHGNEVTRLSLNLTAKESVFSPQMAIIRLRPPASWKPQAMQVQIRGEETGNPAVVPPTVPMAVYIDASLGQPVSLPEAQVMNNGVLLADLIFDETTVMADGTGPLSPWINSSLVDFEGPKLTIVMPGIDVTRLPQIE